MAILVNFAVLNALLFAIKHFAEGTPNRWEFICKYVQECPKKEPSPCVSLGSGQHGMSKEFKLNSKVNCQKAYKIIRDQYPDLLNPINFCKTLYMDPEKNAFKPVLLLPHDTTCCGKNIVVDGRCSFPLIYTLRGTFVGALFHGRCRECSTVYHYSYKTEGDKRVYYDVRDKSQDFFQVTNATVFSKDYLVDLHNNIWTSGTTFDSRAQVYNCNHRTEDAIRLEKFTSYCRSGEHWALDSRRISDAYFIWSVVKYYSENGTIHLQDLTIHRGDVSHMLNVEELCEKMWKSICDSNNKWIEHSCRTPGCSEGYVTVDGNEYLCRDMCAAPKEKVRISKDLPTIVRCCPNSPITGGLHQTASKFCKEHFLDKETGGLNRLPELKSVNKSQVGDSLPDNDSDSLLTGCKKAKNLNRVFNRTAGMLALIRPCGIVVSMAEMFSCESPTQVFIFLLRTFCGSVQEFQRLKYVGYDRTCDLVPFLKNQYKNGSAGAGLLLDNVKFLLDIFHANKHTEPTCFPPSNPECLYHPHLERFSEIKGTNTESCEQAFVRLNKYFHLTRKMTQFKRNILFWLVNKTFNEERELQLHSMKLM